MDNEWGLLIDRDGIEIGDELIVEDENGDESIWKLITYNNKVVYLKNHEGLVAKFSTETLESGSGYMVIIGKNQLP